MSSYFAKNDEEFIWNLLMQDIQNPYGVAGLMGNLFAESSLNPLCKTGGDKKIKGEEYAIKVNNGEISMDEFSHDGVAFGIAQWRYWSRKERLYIYTVKRNLDIQEIVHQVGFLIEEIKTYKTVWNILLSATSVKEASDIVMLRYEKPSNTSDAAKEKRASFGQIYLDRYAHICKPVMVATTVNNVNVRCGNGKDFGAITQIAKSGSSFPWITTVGDWHAIEITINKRKQVGWISGVYSKIV